MSQSYLDLQKVLSELQTKEKWMAAAWVVEDGKIKMVDRITHQFPTDDFLAAIGQLAHNCHEEKLACDKAEKLAAPREELPSDPLPLVKMFKMPFRGEVGGKLEDILVTGDGYPKIDKDVITKVPEESTIPPPNGGPFDNAFIDTSEERPLEVPNNENGTLIQELTPEEWNKTRNDCP